MSETAANEDHHENDPVTQALAKRAFLYTQAVATGVINSLALQSGAGSRRTVSPNSDIPGPGSAIDIKTPADYHDQTGIYVVSAEYHPNSGPDDPRPAARIDLEADKPRFAQYWSNAQGDAIVVPIDFQGVIIFANPNGTYSVHSINLATDNRGERGWADAFNEPRLYPNRFPPATSYEDAVAQFNGDVERTLKDFFAAATASANEHGFVPPVV